MKKFSLFLLLLAACAAGCDSDSPLAAAPVPAPNAPFAAIWSYAAGLERGVEQYSPRRFGSYPEGLRAATAAVRVDFLAGQPLPNAKPDLQCYLFFEYRRQKGLAGSATPGEPDPATARYVRALLAALRSGAADGRSGF